MTAEEGMTTGERTGVGRCIDQIMVRFPNKTDKFDMKGDMI